jgi:two-component system, NtrC family, response regulator GlrR
MPTDRDSFDDIVETDLQRELALPQQVLRHRPEVHWSDARGTHTTALDHRTTLGSAPNMDVPIADRTVSRIHAELDPRADGVWIRDLGSRNGTFVEEVRVVEARVPDGGRLRVGSTTLVVRYRPEPVPIQLWPSDRFGALVGRSTAMRELFATLDSIARADATVMIQGETGTGKELVARAIHERSSRAAGPFVVVDCAAIPETLFESELFGHARGAFTGAISAQGGAIQAADGGTLFFDEIGELPLALQPKLLRVLESRTVRPLGETQHRPIDARFFSATHRDLREMVNAGAFREDLYFRLSVLPIMVPPLRQRPEDIDPLVAHFLAAFGASAPLPQAVVEDLRARPWLGNVRELRNVVERIVALGPERARVMTDAQSAPLPSTEPRPLAQAFLDKPLKELREDVEREYVRGLLERHGRNVNAVAAAAGIDRTYVYRLIKKYAL